MVMDGQEAAGGAGGHCGPGLELTVEHDPDSEPALGPVWTCGVEGLARSDCDQ